MRISIICFSLTGYMTAEDLQKDLQGKGYTAEIYKKSKYLDDSIAESTGIWAGRHFETDDAIIFVGACGIAVRSIAPYVASKKSDPAVLVIDECGKFVISLLSGHLGGANELTLEVAELLGAVPVVTTATDLHHRFAVDVFAKRNCCGIQNMKAAKEVSAALLAGRTCRILQCNFHGQEACRKAWKSLRKTRRINPEIGIAVTIHPTCKPFTSTVQIIPRVVTLGMGCRRNKEADVIEKEASVCLADADIYSQAVEKLTSISIKKDEVGLQKLAEDWRIPFITFEEEELSHAEGNLPLPNL